MLQQPEDRLGDEPKETVVDGQFQARGEFLQVLLEFRAGIQGQVGFTLLPAGTLRVGPVKPTM